MVNMAPMMECATIPMQQNSELWFQTCVGAQKTAELYGFCEGNTSWHSWGREHCGREREGGCGPDVQEELAAPVQVVGRVKSEKAAHWEGFSSFWKDHH